MDLKGAEVLVLGIGASGTGAARLLARQGARVRCSDSGAGPDARCRAEALGRIGCRVEVGGHTEAFLRGVSCAVISPGIDPSIPAVRRLVDDGVELVSEIELAYAFCSKPVIAVTGTNGKTTTVTLLERILREDGRRVAACGNIGTPFSECVMEDGAADIFVLEVSSFQLEAVRAFKPWIAIALNIAPDHLDRYRSIGEYAEAKAAIFRNQGAGDWAIVRAEERGAWERRGMRGPQAVLEFSSRRILGEGACVEGGALVVTRGGSRGVICARDGLRLGGLHNLENALAAVAAASICGVRPESMRRVLAEFGGLPHRLEPAGTWRGVSFVNDSKATNPDAVMRALESAVGPVVLIAGGRDKGFDYSVLRGEVSRTVKGLVLIGEAREKMARDLAGAAETRGAGSLGEAVRIAAEMAAPGDTVMLSPACSSYDMFRNYEERGDEFKRSVRELTGTAGCAAAGVRKRYGEGERRRA